MVDVRAEALYRITFKAPGFIEVEVVRQKLKVNESAFYAPAHKIRKREQHRILIDLSSLNEMIKWRSVDGKFH